MASSIPSPSHQVDEQRPPLALMVILAIAALRLTSSHEPFPAWTSDPLAFPAPVVGVTPLISLMLDGACCLAASLLMFRTGAPLRWIVMLTVGVLGVAYHSVVRQSLSATLEGVQWCTCLLSAVGVARACAVSEQHRAFCAAALLTVIPVVLLRGVTQITLEHGQTVASFNTNKVMFLQSQGWEENSPNALAYVRRLMQPEATGWMGFSNVYAGICAAAMTICAGCAIFGKVRWARVVMGISAVACAAGVYLAGSKGGAAAALAGMGCLVLYYVMLHTRAGGVVTGGDRRWLGPQRIGVILASAAVVGVLGAVVARGLVGTRLAELSILFRWFYLEGAARIIADSPLVGTGPGHFRDAYLLFKNPIAPEDVASPHSILFDYVATLGVAGVALAIVWFGLVASSAAPAKQDCDQETQSVPIRPALRLAALAAALGVVGAAMLEQAVVSPSVTLVRILGLALGTVLAGAVLTLGAPAPALGAAAIVIAAHSQIEMTLTTPASILWLMLAMAVGAGTVVCSQDRHRYSTLLPGTCILAILIITLPGIARWEVALRAAGETASTFSTFVLRMQNVSKGDERAASVVNDLQTELQQPITDVNTAMITLQRRSAERALTELTKAQQARPDHFGTARAQSRLHLVLASLDTANAAAHRSAALSIAQRANVDPTAVSASWLATVHGAQQPADVTAQVKALALASSLSPHEPSHMATLAELLKRTDPAIASDWAKRALECSRKRHLDPLLQLSEREIALLQRIIENPAAR
jgi:hypothetical protein